MPMTKKLVQQNLAPSLYYDKESHNVYVEINKDEFGTESFTPTLSWNEGDVGFVVVVESSKYDSNGSYGDHDFTVIDAYKDENIAHTVAKLVLETVAYGADQKPFHIPLADGKNEMTNVSQSGRGMSYFPWTGWGNTFEKVGVYEFKLTKQKKKIEYTRWD